AESRLNQTEFAQPALFALQVALCALWRSWGVEPEAVVGHSAGEVAAAYVSGALSLDQGVQLICTRAQVMKKISLDGAMASLAISDQDAEKLCRRIGDRVSVAAYNGPRLTLVSGDATAVDEVMRYCRARRISRKLLPGNYAFHSS